MTRTDPAAWIRAYLREHGETPSSTVKQAGAEAGYSDSSLKRARKRAGVTAREVRTDTGRETAWTLASATTTPLTTTRPDPAQSDVPEPTGPPCPSCGFKWPVQVNLPGAAWWCSYCGHRWDP